MADSQSRVVAALNYLTGEGVSFYPDGCDHAALEALIDEYFDPQGGNDDTSEESDPDTEGVLKNYHAIHLTILNIDEQEVAPLIQSTSGPLSEVPGNIK